MGRTARTHRAQSTTLPLNAHPYMLRRVLATGALILRIGIDTGGTFTDLLAWDGRSLYRAKVPSTPPHFDQGVLHGIHRVTQPNQPAGLVHGSTVATNALLERKGHPAAFITTDGFGDMLHIGRQNRPNLYALEPSRPPPIIPRENCFTVAERIDAMGNVLTPLEETESDRVLNEIRARGLQHVAVCLLFSFINPVHEQLLGEHLRRAGLTVTLSSELLPEFREYERACATAINASLRPNVENYLSRISSNLPSEIHSFNVMQSAGGTLPPSVAAIQASRLLLSGPAGGVLGASYIAGVENLQRIITYDMGGTSTDVAASVDGKPPWTTSSVISGLPVALPMFDIHTIGAGGGSIAFLDSGGALQVGPASAGAVPGPACYERGGTLPTVTDANVVLGRIQPAHFLGGEMNLRFDLAESAVSSLAKQLNKSIRETALGILKLAESHMASAIRHVTASRGYDPRTFSILSFGGASGLHAAALADSLDVHSVVIPPHAGVLSALGMIIAPPSVSVSRTIVHLGDQLDDNRLYAEFGNLSARSSDSLSTSETAKIEAFADCRFKGQSYEVMVPVTRPSVELIESAFREAYAQRYSRCPEGRSIEIVTLRVRRIGHAPSLALPPLTGVPKINTSAVVTLPDGTNANIPTLDRAALRDAGKLSGPALLIDADATTFVPTNWSARVSPIGSIILERKESR